MNPFEIKKVTSINKTIRLPSDLCDQIERLATDAGISFNQFIFQAVLYSMENLKTDTATTETKTDEAKKND